LGSAVCIVTGYCLGCDSWQGQWITSLPLCPYWFWCPSNLQIGGTLALIKKISHITQVIYTSL